MDLSAHQQASSTTDQYVTPSLLIPDITLPGPCVDNESTHHDMMVRQQEYGPRTRESGTGYLVSVVAIATKMQTIVTDQRGTILATQQSSAVGLTTRSIGLKAAVCAVIRIAGVSLEQVQHITYCQLESATPSPTEDLTALIPAQIPVSIVTIARWIQPEQPDAEPAPAS